MEYHTTFNGEFKIDRPVDEETAMLLRGLCSTPRLKRNIEGYGVEGEFYVGGNDDNGQDHTVVDHNHPPSTQPSLWCDWELMANNQTIIGPDESSTFRLWTEWIEYLITAVLAPRSYVVNGEDNWQGEDYDDTGAIVVRQNVVTEYYGYILYATNNTEGLPAACTRLLEKVERAASIRKALLTEDWAELGMIAKELKGILETIYGGAA